MSDKLPMDVQRHYLELKANLIEDGFDLSHPVMKVANKLKKALAADGFVFPSDMEEVPNQKSVEVETKKEASTAELEKALVLRAFRAKDSYDAKIIVSVFKDVPGWKTWDKEHNGSYFVVTTNGQDLTSDQIKKAIRLYVEEKPQDNL